MKRLAPILVAAALASTQPACLGSYSATKTLNKWNHGATGNKNLNSVIHFGFWIPLPVYELAIVGDFLIFNNVEFFTGKPVFGS